MPLVHSQPELFHEAPSPAQDLVDAFEAWVKAAREEGQLRRPSSESTYRDLWQVLSKWCLSRTPPVSIDSLSATDLARFIASRSSGAGDAELSPRYVWRLLHLVNRVLTHRAGLQGTSRNLAAADLLNNRPEWRFAQAAKMDPLPAYLDASQAKRLVSFLSQARPRPGNRGAASTWQELRDQTSIGLQLGAGVGPGEIRALTLGSVVTEGGRLEGVPWKVVIARSGSSPSRETPIAQWAGQLLRHWLQTRSELSIAGNYLFPSTKTGKPWGKVAQYLSSKHVLEAAGLDEALVAGGSFRLRPPLALRQPRRGKSEADVARWLGVMDGAAMERYRRILSEPVDDLV